MPSPRPPAVAPPGAACAEDLQHQERAFLSLLAGGISHDFNNLLGAMIGHVELARMELPGDAPVLGRLQAIEALIGRASALVDQMLAYAGRGRYQVETLDLNAQVEAATRVLRSSLAGRVALGWEPSPDLPPMAGRLAQIQQLIVNLVLNAAEAVPPEGGAITLRTACRVLDLASLQKDFPGQAVAPGPHLVLEVTDNGRGMSPEVQARIFEPFFSTKTGARGLGLSAVQGIVRSHGGGLQVLTGPGQGATFRLFFPVVAKAAEATSPAVSPQAGAYQGGGTILVVDDEEPLRSVAVEALGRMGFATLEARDGLEALEAYHAHGDPIRLVLMNLTMPRMDGEEAFQALRRAGLRAPVVLSSGFSREEALRRFQGKGLAGYLERPYRYLDLVQVVQTSLQAPG